MKKLVLKDRTKKTILRVTDSVVSTGVLVLAINSLTDFSGGDPSVIPGILMLALTLGRLLRLLQQTEPKKKLAQCFDLGVFVIFLATAVGLLLPLDPVFKLRLLGISFFTSLLANRILAILRKPKLRSIVFNVLMSLLWLYLILAFFLDRFDDLSTYVQLALMVTLSIVLQSLGHIVSLSFSQMKLNLLLKIVRKTFAAEVLFGLVLLITAFSFVFQFFEPAVETYADALWYCFAVVTTIGFGDFTVMSGIGRVLSVILGIYGIIVVAVLTSIIVNFYMEVKGEEDPQDDPKPPAAEIPPANAPAAEIPPANAPAADTPPAEIPPANAPAADTPPANAPAVEPPDSEKPL